MPKPNPKKPDPMRHIERTPLGYLARFTKPTKKEEPKPYPTSYFWQKTMVNDPPLNRSGYSGGL